MIRIALAQKLLVRLNAKAREVRLQHTAASCTMPLPALMKS